MTMHSSAAIAPGTRLLDDYLIESEFGVDQCGIIYLAHEVGLDRKVTIKEYLPAKWGARRKDGSIGPSDATVSDEYAQGLTSFLDDARILASVEHHQIARVHRIVEARGTAYLITEHIRGRSLEQEIRAASPLSASAVQTMLDGLAAGLAEVHSLGLLHLDIKPSNVMLRSRDSTAVLTGFGSGRSRAGDGSMALWTLPTPGFAPIEQYSPSGKQGPWSDIYALGAVGYAALTGQVPVDAPERVRRDTLPDVRAAAAQPIGAALALAVKAAMQVDEADRPQHSDDWRRMLVATPREDVAPAVRPRKRRVRAAGVNRRRLFYGVGVAVIAAGVMAVVSVARNTSLTPQQRAAAAEVQLGLDEQTLTLVEKGLAADGLYSGEPDGVLEPEARAAVLEWQAGRDIEATGYLDRASLSELMELGREADRRAEVTRLEADRQAEAQGQLEEARRRAAEAERLAARRLAETQRLAEEQRRAEAERADLERRAAEADSEAEVRRLEAERLAAARQAEEERLEAERRAEEERRAETERLVEEERLEAERRAEAERREAELLAEAQQLAEAQRLAEAREGVSDVLLAAGSAMAGASGQLNWRRDVNWVRWTGLVFDGGRISGVDLKSQNLSGVIPARLARLGELEYLDLSGNRLSGRIPPELGFLTKLEVLYLNNNQLSGQIPAELGSLSSLVDLYLHNNRLTGSLPPQLGRLSNLTRLRLSNTQVAGEIPPELGALRRLEVLSLADNQLSGEIPAALENLSGLRRLSLSNNRLSGCIPRALRRFESDINPQQDGVTLPRCEGR